MKTFFAAIALATTVSAAHAQYTPANILVSIDGTEYGAAKYDSLLDPSAAGKTRLFSHVVVGNAAQGQAESFADLASATLRGLAASPGHNSTAYSRANIRDEFTLSNIGSVRTSRLTYLFDGAFLPGEFHLSELALAHLSIQMRNYNPATGQLRTWERNVFLDTYNCDRFNYPGQTCVRGSQLFELGSMDIELSPGIYWFEMGLNLQAAHGWQANFLSTGRAYFELPEGVTIDSKSGVLFSSATPVPEPHTGALFFVGLALLGNRLSRRRVNPVV